MLYKWCEEHESVTGYADSDWAGDKVEAKSTSGGVLEWGGHVMETWSTIQNTIALSSGEAELYALTKAAAQALGLMSILNDFGIKVNSRLFTDSTAAIGIVHREGLGRTRHIRVQYLWLQEKVNNGTVEVEKVKGETNRADVLTKFKDGNALKQQLDWTNQIINFGRHELAPKLSKVDPLEELLDSENEEEQL